MRRSMKADGDVVVLPGSGGSETLAGPPIATGTWLGLA